MILGQPVFPENTPRARLNGRKISILWVNISTPGHQIKDPLFGFRVYPVKSFMGIASKVRLGKRMDFDTDIAVRLYWKGLDVVNIKTPVTYYDDGVSSFRMFRDNVRISWMHTRLFFGMIFRAWKLVTRRNKS